MRFRFPLLFVLSVILFAQFAPAAELASDAPLMVELLSEYPIYSFYLGAPAVSGVAYLPHAHPKFGPRLFIYGVGVAATFPVDVTHDDELRGKSEQTSIIVSPFRRTFGFDFYFQSFRGLYESNPLTELNATKPARYPQLPNATVRNFGVNSYIALSSTGYSLAAAFLQTEFQTESGGSWLLEPFYNHVELNTGDVFIPSSDPQLPQVRPDVQSARMDTTGLAIGYGYTWIDEAFYFSLLGAFGGGYQTIDVMRVDTTRFSTVCAGLKANVNAATGLNFQNYTVGIKILVDSLYTNVNQTTITSTTANGQFFLGARF